MFEDFSFTSPSSRPARLALDAEDRLMADCNSPLISPLSSRCSSPHRLRTLSRPRSSYFRSQQPPTSVPLAYEQNRLSISTLTQKLHEHTIQGPNGERIPDQGHLDREGARVSRYSGYVLTPPDTDHDEDGRFDSSPSLCSNPSPTSVPPDFLALDGTMPEPKLPDHQNIRRQRQHISEMQCHEGDVDSIRRNAFSDDSYPGTFYAAPILATSKSSHLTPESVWTTGLVGRSGRGTGPKKEQFGGDAVASDREGLSYVQ
ncbi:unnamed protein product [Penicillium pancosmium]